MTGALARERGGPIARGVRATLVAVNVASLDAPAVAVVWGALLGRAAGRTPTGVELTLLASGVWLGYAADRLLDGRRLGPRAGTARHRAAARHPVLLGLVWSAVLAASALGAWAHLDPGILARGVALAALVGGYSVAVATWPSTVRRTVPRELAVGALFAAGCAVFGFGMAAPSPAALTVSLLFAGLCVANCLAVALAERELDRAAGELSTATAWPGLGRAFGPAVGSLAFVSLLAAVVGPGGAAGAACLALAAAAVGLLFLERARPAVGIFPAVADLCLWAPAVAILALS